MFSSRWVSPYCCTATQLIAGKQALLSPSQTPAIFLKGLFTKTQPLLKAAAAPSVTKDNTFSIDQQPRSSTSKNKIVPTPAQRRRAAQLRTVLRVLAQRPPGPFPLPDSALATLRKLARAKRTRNHRDEASPHASAQAANGRVSSSRTQSLEQPTWRDLLPENYLPVVQTALMEIVLSAPGPLTTEEVLSSFQKGARATVRDEDFGNPMGDKRNGSTKQRRTNGRKTTTLEKHDGDEVPREASCNTLHWQARWIEYALALTALEQYVCREVRISRATCSADVQHGENIKSSPTGATSAVAKHHDRRQKHRERRAVIHRMHRVLTHPQSRAFLQELYSQQTSTSLFEKGTARERRATMAHIHRILQDCVLPPVTKVARLYQGLYARSILPLLSPPAQHRGRDGSPQVQAIRVSVWAPLALLLSGPHFRVSPSALSGDTKAPSSLPEPHLVCFPVQPSVMAAAMDPTHLPSLREYLAQEKKRSHALPRGTESSPRRRQSRRAWTYAASLAHCTDAARALAGVSVLHVSDPRHGASASVSTTSALSVAQPSLAGVWVQWAVGKSGGATSVMEEGLGVAAVLTDTAPSWAVHGARARDTKQNKDTVTSNAVNGHTGKEAFAFGSSATSVKQEDRLHRGSTVVGSRRDGTFDNAMHGTTDGDTACPSTPWAARRHPRSAEGRANELLRRATGWNEAVVGNPLLALWGDNLPTTKAALSAGRLQAVADAASPALAHPQTLLRTNRETLQPLMRALLATPLSLARLATILRWNVTVRVAPRYHHSLLYLLLVYMGNPTVAQAQAREEARRPTSFVFPVTTSTTTTTSSRWPLLAESRRRAALFSTALETKKATTRLRMTGLAECYQDSETTLRQLLPEAQAAPRTQDADAAAQTWRARLARARHQAAVREQCSNAPSAAAISLALRLQELKRSAVGRVTNAHVNLLLDAVTSDCGGPGGPDSGLATVGRLLFVRLCRSGTLANASRHAAVKSLPSALAQHCPHVEVLNTDAALPQDILAHLVSELPSRDPSRLSKTGTTEAPPFLLPTSTVQRLEDAFAEDILVFPLSHDVFLVRVCALILRYRQLNHESTTAATASSSPDAPAPTLTVGTLAELLLWTQEFGQCVACELLVVYLSHFPAAVQILPAAEGVLLSKWELVFTV